MATRSSSAVIANWRQESREAAEIVIETYVSARCHDEQANNLALNLMILVERGQIVVAGKYSALRRRCAVSRIRTCSIGAER